MQTDEFVRRVQEEADLSLGDEALRAVEATLATLGERLDRDERDDLAAQLPRQLKEYVLSYGETSRFRLEEFYNRVAARADVGLPAAVQWAQAVISVLNTAVSGGQLQEIRAHLPEEYEELFTGQARGPASTGQETAA